MKNIIILLQNKKKKKKRSHKKKKKKIKKLLKKKKKKKNRCLGRASETIPVLTDGDVEDHRKAHLFAFPACGG